MLKLIKKQAVIIPILIACFIFSNHNIYAAKPKLNLKSAKLSDSCKVKLYVKNTKKKVKWKSSNKDIAEVSSRGVVQAYELGKVTITAKVGKTKLKCKVKIVRGRVKHSKYATGLHSNGLWYKGKFVDDDHGKISKIKQALLTDSEIKKFKKEYLKSGMTDVEKAMAIQKYFLNTGCVYRQKKTPKLANYDKCPYCEFTYGSKGVLYSKQGVCEDYALATKLLCIVCDIPCITMESKKLDHSWCRVKIQGKWYNWDTTAIEGCWGQQDTTRQLNLNGALIVPALYHENEYWNANVSSYNDYKQYGLKKLPKADTSQEIWYVLVDKNDEMTNDYLSEITNINYQQGDILKISCNLKDTVGYFGMWQIMRNDDYNKFNVTLFKRGSSIRTNDYKDEKAVKELWKTYTSNKMRKER